MGLVDHFLEGELRSIATMVAEGRLNPALHVACRLGETAIARDLIDAGADPNTKDTGGANNLGYTPVLTAAIHFHERTEKAVIDRGGNPDAKTSHGNTRDQLRFGAEMECDLKRTPAIKALRAEISEAITAHRAKTTPAPVYAAEFTAAVAAAPLAAEPAPDVPEVLVIAAAEEQAAPPFPEFRLGQ